MHACCTTFLSDVVLSHQHCQHSLVDMATVIVYSYTCSLPPSCIDTLYAPPYCVQVCVAALCLKQKDLLHAGYLAITLLFFRQRTALMIAPAAPQGSAVKGARLFLWLPAFNLLVMTLTMLYQVGRFLPVHARVQMPSDCCVHAMHKIRLRKRAALCTKAARHPQIEGSGRLGVCKRCPRHAQTQAERGWRVQQGSTPSRN